MSSIFGTIIMLTAIAIYFKGGATDKLSMLIQTAVSIILFLLGMIAIFIDTKEEIKMKEYTISYKAEITEILNEEEFAEVPKNENGTIDCQKLAWLAKTALDVDDVVIPKVKVFALEKVEE